MDVRLRDRRDDFAEKRGYEKDPSPPPDPWKAWMRRWDFYLKTKPGSRTALVALKILSGRLGRCGT